MLFIARGLDFIAEERRQILRKTIQQRVYLPYKQPFLYDKMFRKLFW